MHFLFVCDKPELVGLPKLDTQDATSADTAPLTVAYVIKCVFTSPVPLTIAAAEFCTGFVRHGFEQWFPRYMQEAQKLPLNSPVFQKGAIAVVLAGILGAFAAGMLSDWRFNSRRPPVAFIGYTLRILGVVWKAPSVEWVIYAFVVNSMAISIVHSMLSAPRRWISVANAPPPPLPDSSTAYSTSAVPPSVSAWVTCSIGWAGVAGAAHDWLLAHRRDLDAASVACRPESRRRSLARGS